MPAKKYLVDLTAEEREHLQHLIRRGKPAARTIDMLPVL
jgi:hypothetical protein